MSNGTILWGTDVDGTIVPPIDLPGRHEDSAVRGLKDYLRDEFIAKGGIMALATGRSPIVADDILHGANPFPASFAIYSTGTEIYRRTKTGWHPFSDYTQSLSETCFEAERIHTLFTRLARAHASLDLRVQPNHCNTPHKVSYFTNQSLPIPTLREILQGELHGVRANIIISTHDPLKRYVDILPENVGKGHAMAYLANHLMGSGVRLKATIVSGDSANDLGLFAPDEFRAATGLPLMGIVPANARPELTDHTRALAVAGHPIYHPKGHGPAGVHQGLKLCCDRI